MPNNRFNDFLLRELWRAYDDARKGKRSTFDEHRFELNDMANICALRDSIISGNYHPSRGVAFIVHKPVTREIVAAPFRDRVVHHLLFNICGDWWDRHFIYDSYSCRKNKGTLFGQQRLLHHIRCATKNYTIPAYALKLDILGYFMHLPHKELYQRAVWGLDCQLATGQFASQIHCHPSDCKLLYRTARELWYQIIYDQPMKNIIIRGSKSEWKSLPASKSLFHQPSSRGIVIGNLTSQLLSNIYLDQLDRFITLDLGYKHYGRYVDDFYIIVPESLKEQLLRDISVIKTYLTDTLKLTLHPRKVYFQPITHGVPFLGTVVYPRFIVPGQRFQHNFWQAAYNFATTGTGDATDLAAYLGGISHINYRRFANTVFDSLGWDH